MRKNNTIVSYCRTKNCAYCGTHFKPQFNSHELCRQCYHGIRQAQALAVAIEQQRLAHEVE